MVSKNWKLFVARLSGIMLTQDRLKTKIFPAETKKRREQMGRTPYLIKQIVNVLGLGQNEFDVHTNTKITPLSKPLLNIDLEGKLRK